MNTINKRDELLKANLEKLITAVGLEEASHYIVTDKTINEAEKNTLLFLVDRKTTAK